MTDPTYTHWALIVDRSGSMQRIVDDMNGAITTLLQDQRRVPGKLLIDITTFDDKIEFVGRDLDADAALQLGPLVNPRGATALLDAIGATVVRLGEHLAKMSEDQRPSKVLITIVTDGMENSSKEWTLRDVNTRINTQREQFAWEFMFLGANMDAVNVAAGMGIPGSSTMSYHTTGAGVASTMSAVSAQTTRYRSAGPGGQSISFTDEDREAAMDGEQ